MDRSLIFDPSLVKLHLERSRRDTPILFTALKPNYLNLFEEDTQCSLLCCSMERCLNDASSAVNDGLFCFSAMIQENSMTRESWVQKIAMLTDSHTEFCQSEY
ncbi:hypothetical protein HKD37_13G036142 [Glycine soja]